MTTFVHDFADGDMSRADLLGGKGANLAEMTRLGLPVPPGFTITTQACRAYLSGDGVPSDLWPEVTDHLRTVERQTGREFGDPARPLLLSVRSGARFSMPGMMETILNVGLNDDVVEGFSAAGEQRFALDSYRRLIQMFGHTACGVPDDAFANELTAHKERLGVKSDTELTTDSLRELVAAFKAIFATATGSPFPQSPAEQLKRAIEAVFRSWNAPRAIAYRRQEGIAGDLGTAVNIMAMVYGNLGDDSGTGVAFTRDPATGRRGVYGDYLPNAQGEDVVAGIRNTLPLERLGDLDPRSFAELLKHLHTLEAHYRDLCDVEFTIERGKLWMLQTRVGKRTAAAAFVIASDLVDEGVIDLDEALGRVDGQRLAQLMFPTLDEGPAARLLATGVPASPGAAVGRVAFDSEAAIRYARDGQSAVLVRRETNPDDLPGIIAASGVLTSHGGKTSHAAVVARGMGRTCVCGAETMDIDSENRRLSVGDVRVFEGDIISVDGTSGRVYLGRVPVRTSPVAAYLEGAALGDLRQPLEATDAVVTAVARILGHADARRTLGVRANADNADDAARARRLGAEGIGLCRTEHMFLGERRALIEALILADTDDERRAALDALLPLQRADFTAIFTAMNGLPVTVRLLDPPLHEFLPSLEELSVRVAVERERHADTERDTRLLRAVQRMHEENPMLGLRGVRLGLTVPGLFAMQVRAVAEAAAAVNRAGGDARPEIMVPLVGTTGELDMVASEIRRVLNDVPGAPAMPVGTMIEVPRAALISEDLAGIAEFFSYGTNDLTQMVWGYSRDDVEASFLPAYHELGLVDRSPFESIDRRGVGRLISISLAEGRRRRPDLVTGVCGEHGGDPASVHFFAEAGLDYVSCSPFRLPVARLEAARAALPASAADSR